MAQGESFPDIVRPVREVHAVLYDQAIEPHLATGVLHGMATLLRTRQGTTPTQAGNDANFYYTVGKGNLAPATIVGRQLLLPSAYAAASKGYALFRLYGEAAALETNVVAEIEFGATTPDYTEQAGVFFALQFTDGAAQAYEDKHIRILEGSSFEDELLRFSEHFDAGGSVTNINLDLSVVVNTIRTFLDEATAGE